MGARGIVATLSQPSNHDAIEPTIVTLERSAVRLVTIGAEQAGRRLDNVLLSQLRHAPKSLIYKLLRSGQVRINGGRAKPDYRVAAGDVLRIPPVSARSSDPTHVPAARRAALEAAVIFEDSSWIVVNKPSGVACHGGSGRPYGVIEIMRALRPDLTRLDLGHRLDRETSGCLLLSKDLAALHAFHDALRERNTVKQYTTLLRGRLAPDLGRIDASLAMRREAGSERRAAVTDDGKPAATVIESQQACGAHTLVTLRLETGRMHQIRAHARHIGHPVAGDRDYGDKDFNREMRALGLERLFLHAGRLAFDHLSYPLDVSAPLPDALAAVVARLRT